MEEVVFCEGCHRVLSLDYQFCPYCGLERDAPGIPRSLADVIGGQPAAAEPIEEAESGETTPSEDIEVAPSRVRSRSTGSGKEYVLRRLAELSTELEELESELDSILLAPSGAAGGPWPSPQEEAACDGRSRTSS